MNPEPAIFEEVQYFRQHPIVPIAGIAALVVVALPYWIPSSEPSPAFFVRLISLTIGGAVAFLLFLGRLETAVLRDGLSVRLFPLTRRHHFAWSRITEAKARSYRPILEYGGWGIRWGRSGKAYNVLGKRGVQLVFVDGWRLLIGSQRADELAAAIESARAAR